MGLGADDGKVEIMVLVFNDGISEKCMIGVIDGIYVALMGSVSVSTVV